ncbi:recombinase family protein [Bremerella cremea]|uniref:recombinase family protein n=1 Tax=Bremerella cremea TaxID=1031537 RepID=UPI001314394B
MPDEPGKRFNSSSVRRIITSPVYAGDIVSGRHQWGVFVASSTTERRFAKAPDQYEAEHAPVLAT